MTETECRACQGFGVTICQCIETCEFAHTCEECGGAGTVTGGQ